jgi:hypothetical protein
MPFVLAVRCLTYLYCCWGVISVNDECSDFYDKCDANEAIYGWECRWVEIEDFYKICIELLAWVCSWILCNRMP